MRRFQIYLDEDADEALGAEATRRGTSKAALIRLFLADRLSLPRTRPVDPFAELVGAYEGEPGNVDDLLYGLDD